MTTPLRKRAPLRVVANPEPFGAAWPAEPPAIEARRLAGEIAALATKFRGLDLLATKATVAEVRKAIPTMQALLDDLKGTLDG